MEPQGTQISKTIFKNNSSVFREKKNIFLMPQIIKHTNPIGLGPTFIALFNLSYFLGTSSPNTAILRVRVSTNKFGDTQHFSL